MADITFGTDITPNGDVPPQDVDKEPITDLNNPNPSNPPTTPDKDGGEDEKDKQTPNDKKIDNPDDNPDNPDDKNKDDDLLSKAVPGAEFEIDGSKYIVDTEGNLVDEEGNIFKKKDELKEYFDGLNQSDEVDDDKINIHNIIDRVGIDITDDNDKPVEFDDSPQGIADYIKAVIETTQQEIAEATINSLYSRYPIVKDVLDYYLANGNSLDGFTGREDRSSVVIDENDQAQQENIIRIAWKERGQEIDDNYIAYLKSSGTLLQVAEKELENLQNADKEEKARIADEAKRAEQEAIAENQKYWEGVKTVIDSRKVAGYEIPQTILVQREGKQIAVTPNDFFNYLYQVDKEGYSRYQRDIMKQTPESRRDDEILRAFLTFTGGSYANLVDMAIKQKEVTKLRSKAKEANAHRTTVKVNTPPKNNKEINFGN